MEATAPPRDYRSGQSKDKAYERIVTGPLLRRTSTLTRISDILYAPNLDLMILLPFDSDEILLYSFEPQHAGAAFGQRLATQDRQDVVQYQSKCRHHTMFVAHQVIMAIYVDKDKVLLSSHEDQQGQAYLSCWDIHRPVIPTLFHRIVLTQSRPIRLMVYSPEVQSLMTLSRESSSLVVYHWPSIIAGLPRREDDNVPEGNNFVQTSTDARMTLKISTTLEPLWSHTLETAHSVATITTLLSLSPPLGEDQDPDKQSGRHAAPLDDHGDPMEDKRRFPLIATGSSDGIISLYSYGNPQAQSHVTQRSCRQLEAHSDGVKGMMAHKVYLFSYGQCRSAKEESLKIAIWNIFSGKLVHYLTGHCHPILGMKIVPEEDHVVSREFV